MIWISYFILASLLTCYLKVGGSVLNDEPSFGFDLHYAATLHVDEFVVSLQTKNASRDISCTFGQHFISEMKILPQDSDFARMEQAIKSRIALESGLFLRYSFVEKVFEVVRHFFQGIGMVVERTMSSNVQFVDQWAMFGRSRINDSRKGLLLAPMELSPIFRVGQWHNFSKGGNVSVRIEAEGTIKETALDYYDTEAFQDEEALHVADLQSQSNHTVFGSEGLPRAAMYRWKEFEAARALNDWNPDGIILTSFEEKDGSKMPSKHHNYAGADEDEFYPTVTAANAPEFIGQEKWQGNGKQGKESAARAKVAAQQSATPRGKGGKGNGGGGGGWKARSGGAAAVESDELMIEELKSQLLEQKAAATEARLKLLESQAAAKSQGWGL